MGSITPLKLNIAKRLEKDEKFRIRFFKGQMEDLAAMDIRALRRKRKMTQIDLANKSGIPRSVISSIEQGHHSIVCDFKTLWLVANSLDARLRITIEPVEKIIEEYKGRE